MKRIDNPYHWCTATDVCCAAPGDQSDPHRDHCPCHSEPEYHGVATLMRRVRRDQRRRWIVSALLGLLIGWPGGEALAYPGTRTSAALFAVAGVAALGTVVFHLKAHQWSLGDRHQLEEAGRTLDRLIERSS